MKVSIRVASYKIEVLSNEGVELLKASSENIAFDGDVEALVAEFGRIVATLEDPEDFTKQ